MDYSRDIFLNDKIVILDGLTGTGKTMFTPLISSFKRVQNAFMIKRLIKYIFLFPTHIFNIAFQVYEKIISGIFPQLNGALRQPFINYVDNDKKLTLYDSTSFYLYTPNDICNFRHSTCSSKEPEMRNWIEEYGGGVFFDIGANIGIYSLYYTQAKDGNVYSF